MHGNKNHHLHQKSTSSKFRRDQTLTMKVHQLTPGIWDHHEPAAFLSLGCKRLRPLDPRLTTTNNDPTISPLNLKSFIRPETSPGWIEDGNDSNPHVRSPRAETHPGGTRWNPTQEQIGILEMLYGGGMRTPNAQQIEQITAQLGEYGKIEGKNVFYWFQNHKARERQKQKRSSLMYIHSPLTLSSISVVSCGGREEHINREDDAPCKRKCRSWEAEFSQVCGDEGKTNSSSGEEDGSSVVLKTLELFPLRPEGR